MRMSWSSRSTSDRRPPVPRRFAAVLRPARSWRAWLHHGIRRLYQDRFVVVGSSQTQRTGPGLPPERAAEPVMLMPKVARATPDNRRGPQLLGRGTVATVVLDAGCASDRVRGARRSAGRSARQPRNCRTRCCRERPPAPWITRLRSWPAVPADRWWTSPSAQPRAAA